MSNFAALRGVRVWVRTGIQLLRLFWLIFVGACELGKQIARMWAVKLKADFPLDRFRVYYTQNDNPIVRFHKVRDNNLCGFLTLPCVRPPTVVLPAP